MTLLSYNPLTTESPVLKHFYDDSGIRWYEKDKNYYIGATSALSATKSAYSTLAIARYAQENPDKAALWGRARDYGTDYHAHLAEIMQGRRSITGEMFEPWFNEIAEVVLSETSFASGKLKLAGTVDALVKLHDGTYQLVDFKTSIKEKTRSSCYDYFVQLGLYTLLLEEQLKIEIPTAAIFMLYYDIETLAPIKPLRFDTNEKQLTRQREKAYNRLDQFYMKYNDF